MRRSLAALAVAAALLAPSLGAQSLESTIGAGRNNARRGFYAMFGLGGGSLAVTCRDCAGDRETAPAVAIALGGSLNPHLKLGAEINGWSKIEDVVTTTSAFLTGVAQFYPDAAGDFWLKGGIGAGGVRSEGTPRTGGRQELESAGGGFQLGTGYDLRLGSAWGLTPAVNYLRTFGAKAQQNGMELNEGLNHNLLMFTVAVSYR